MAEQEYVREEQPQEEQDYREEAEEQVEAGGDVGAGEEKAERGRGGKRREVDRETITYLQRIERLLDKNEFASEEELTGFLENTYADMEGQEVMLSSHVFGSKIVERLLRMGSPFMVRGFFSRLTRKKERVVQLCTDRYSSHVMETVLARVPDAVPLDDAAPPGDEEGEGAGEEQEAQGRPAKVEESVLCVCEGVEHSLLDLMQQAHSSHVLRALLRLLSGLRLQAAGEKRGGGASGKKHLKGAGSVEGEPWEAPVSFTAALVRLGAAVLRNPPKQVDFLAFHTYASPVLAALLEALARVDDTGGQRVGPILRQLLHLQEAAPPSAGDGEAEEGDSGKARHAERLASHAVGSHLFETAIKVAPPDVYGDVYTRALRHRFAELAAHRSANFLVQRALERATHEAQVAMAYDELQGSIGELLRSGRAGVVLKLAEACGRFGVRNKELCKTVAAAVEAHRPPKSKRLAHVLLAADSRYPAEEGPPQPTTLGALIVQALLKLEAGSNKLLVESFMGMDRGSVAALAKDGAGSRALEALLRQCPGLGPPDRLRFVAKLKGTFADLAGDRAGSHVVETCYAVSDVGLKRSIVEELAKEEEKLASNTYGRHTIKACKVQHYKRKADEWETEETGNEAKRRVFADLLGDEAPAPKAPKPQAAARPKPAPEPGAGASEGEKGAPRSARGIVEAHGALRSILSTLGFAAPGGGEGEAEGAGKKRKKKEKKGKKGRAAEAEASSGLELRADEGEDDAEGGDLAAEAEAAEFQTQDPEVEALFRRGPKRRRGAPESSEGEEGGEERAAGESGDEEGEAAAVDPSLSFILDAIGSTAKKQVAKKQKQKDANSKEGKAKKTPGAKPAAKKKKFSMH
eukprot:tig00021234_g19391.t1